MAEKDSLTAPALGARAIVGLVAVMYQVSRRARVVIKALRET